MDTEQLNKELAKTALFRKMTDQQKAGVRQVVKSFEQFGAGMHTRLSYILATVYHETGGRMEPVRETFANSDEEAIRRLDRAYEQGQLTWVKEPYWSDGWFGRGYVQLTHKYNYSGELRDAVLAVFGVDIEKEPSQVLKPEVSAFILVEGMLTGRTSKGDFTGESLNDFVNEDKTDYYNARRVINPGEKTSYQKIADYAEVFEQAIFSTLLLSGAPFRGFIDADPYDGTPSNTVLEIQRRLRSLGYYAVGAADGRWGPDTAGAVLAFRNDNKLPTQAKIDDDLLAAMMKAAPKPVAEQRAQTTVDDLRKKDSKTIKAADNASVVGYGTAAAAGIAAIDPIINNAEKYGKAATVFGKFVDPVQNFIESNSLLLLAVAGGVIVWQAWRMKQIRLEEYRSGENR